MLALDFPVALRIGEGEAQPSAWNIESRHSVKLVKAGSIQCVHRDDERVYRTIQAFAPQYKVEEGVLLRR